MSECFTTEQLQHLRNAGCYPIEAYHFVRDGLTWTSEQILAEDRESLGLSRHVSGQELCMGLRDLAIHRYGMLARMVLEVWGVHRTEDFGHLVYAMIDAGFFREASADSIDDFSNVYDFREAFDPRDMESFIDAASRG